MVEFVTGAILDFGFWILIAEFNSSDETSESKIQNPKSKML